MWGIDGGFLDKKCPSYPAGHHPSGLWRFVCVQGHGWRFRSCLLRRARISATTMFEMPSYQPAVSAKVYEATAQPFLACSVSIHSRCLSQPLLCSAPAFRNRGIHTTSAQALHAASYTLQASSPCVQRLAQSMRSAFTCANLERFSAAPGTVL